MDRAWRDGRGEVEAAGQRMVEALVSRQGSDVAAEAPTAAVFEGVLDGLTRTFDTRNGSWGGAPKFPQPMTIEYLLRRMAGGDTRPGAIARFTLEKMADGGIHDQLGGGFHRYATDAIWLVPHFEQMLYDNAQLARAYLHAWAATGDERFRAVALEVLEYMLRELVLPDGAFAASQDADTDGVEGLTFIWTAAEIRDVLGADADPFLAAYGVTDEGNWEGRAILCESGPISRRRPTARIRPSRRCSRAAGRRCSSGARRGRSRSATTRPSPHGTDWRSGRSLTRAGSSGSRTSPTRPSAPPRRSWAASSRPGCPGPVLEGRARERPGRPRGLHAPRRGAARPLRGDLR